MGVGGQSDRAHTCGGRGWCMWGKLELPYKNFGLINVDYVLRALRCGQHIVKVDYLLEQLVFILFYISTPETVSSYTQT